MSEEKQEYKPNSHRYKQTEAKEQEEKKKEIKAVAKGTVKQSTGKKIMRSFISDDTQGIGSQILMDYLIPGAKEIILEAVINTLDVMFYGESRRDRSSSGRRGRGGYVSYRDYSRSDRDRDRYRDRDRDDDYRRITTDDVVFDNRADAEEVLHSMEEIIDSYGVVRLADFYELAGVDTSNWQANKYGWSSLRNAEIQGTREGYIIRFSRPYVLE